MADNQQRMLDGFASYRVPVQNTSGLDHDTIGMPLGTRLMRVIRLTHGWRMWIATNDYKYGSYLEFYDNGLIIRVTTRPDEGDEIFWVRPCDALIRDMEQPR